MTTCVDCGRTMRPYKTSLIEYPGTVSHGTAQRCSGCRKRIEKPPKFRRRSEEDLDYTIAELEFLLGTDEPTSLATRLGWRLERLRDMLRARGRTDLAQALINNETSGIAA